MLRFLSVSVLVVSFLPCAIVGAQSPEENPEWLEAASIFDRGAAHFQAGRHALAVDDFRRAHQLLEGHPRQFMSLYNLSRAYEELGRLDRAIPAMREFLEAGGESTNQADDARDRLADMERRRALESEESGGRSGGGGGGPSLAPWLTAAGGVVVAIVGIPLMVVADQEAAEVRDAPDGTRWDALSGQADRADAMWTAGQVLLVAGGVIALAGLTWGIIDLSLGSSETEVAIGPGGVSLRGSF